MYNPQNRSRKLERALQPTNSFSAESPTKCLRGPQDCKVLVLTAPCHLRRLPRCSWPLRLQLTRSLPSRHCFSLAPLTGLTGTTRARRPAVNVVGGTWLAVELCIFFDYLSHALLFLAPCFLGDSAYD